MIETEAPMPVGVDLGQVAYESFQAATQQQGTFWAWQALPEATRETWRGCADGVRMFLQLDGVARQAGFRELPATTYVYIEPPGNQRGPVHTELRVAVWEWSRFAHCLLCERGPNGDIRIMRSEELRGLTTEPMDEHYDRPTILDPLFGERDPIDDMTEPEEPTGDVGGTVPWDGQMTVPSWSRAQPDDDPPEDELEGVGSPRTHQAARGSEAPTPAPSPQES